MCPLPQSFLLSIEFVSDRVAKEKVEVALSLSAWESNPAFARTTHS